MPKPIQPENLLDVLTFRIADPGTFVHRKLSISGPLETVPRWAARAVVAGLTDGTLGYVSAAQLADIQAELARTIHAREDIPALLAEVDELRAELDYERRSRFAYEERVSEQVGDLRTEIDRLRTVADAEDKTRD